jgi:hypothetical protein
MGVSDESTKPPERGRGSDIGAMFWPVRHLGVWLSGDAYADLALEAISREREYMRLLEDQPRHGDKEARPAEPATTADVAQHDPLPRPPDRPPSAQTPPA